MRCRTVRRKLTVYRELDAAERERLQQHLDRCPRCAEAFAAYRAMDGMLSALPPIEPSPRLAATVRACIARSRPTPALVVPRWAYSFLAVLLAFALPAFADYDVGITHGTNKHRPEFGFFPNDAYRLYSAQNEWATSCVRVTRSPASSTSGWSSGISRSMPLTWSLTEVAPSAWT